MQPYVFAQDDSLSKIIDMEMRVNFHSLVAGWRMMLKKVYDSMSAGILVTLRRSRIGLSILLGSY